VSPWGEEALTFTSGAPIGTKAGGVVENRHSTDVEYPLPSPYIPCVCTSMSIHKGLIEKKYWADFESSPPPPHAPRVCMRNLTEGESCSDLGRVLVLNDPPIRAPREGAPRASPPVLASFTWRRPRESVSMAERGL